MKEEEEEENLSNNPESEESKKYDPEENSISDFNSDIFALASAMTVISIRKGRSYSQGAAAAAAGINQSYLSNVENGKLALSFSKLFRLCEGIGVCAKEAACLYVENSRKAQKVQRHFYENREAFSKYESFHDYIPTQIDKEK
ncbi:MAG: helix-turn-helix domain-containing protein [Saccharofermentanales bacterium]